MPWLPRISSSWAMHSVHGDGGVALVGQQQADLDVPAALAQVGDRS